MSQQDCPVCHGLPNFKETCPSCGKSWPPVEVKMTREARCELYCETRCKDNPSLQAYIKALEAENDQLRDSGYAANLEREIVGLKGRLEKAEAALRKIAGHPTAGIAIRFHANQALAAYDGEGI